MAWAVAIVSMLLHANFRKIWRCCAHFFIFENNVHLSSAPFKEGMTLPDLSSLSVEKYLGSKELSDNFLFIYKDAHFFFLLINAPLQK